MMSDTSASEHNEYVIYVRNAMKFYGQKKVLNDFCMKVPRGCIYGLLGASGCGKTTLLSCLVSLKEVDSGDVYVFGGEPGTPESGVPGPIVGYMPQDIALVAEFTVREAVYYFGRIYNMDDWLIKERFEMLKALLKLPPDDRQLRNCSGGQQRRVSFAAAMVHKPQLLILDEPTVGLDPVLRDNIWNHLVEIAGKEQTTIIITTHYIEEARKAHKIGLMREGQLLAEESPERLLQLLNTETLEEAFLLLYSRQKEGQELGTQELHSSNMMTLPVEASGPSNLPTPVSIQKKHYKNRTTVINLNRFHLKTLLSKNITHMLRNIGYLGFAFIFPVLQMLLVLMAIGRDPHGLKLAIINEDAHSKQCANYTKNGTAMPYSSGKCHLSNLACRFLNDIKNPMFDEVYYDNLHDAFEDVRRGQVVGVLHMAQNFSNAYSNRINHGSKVSSEDLDFSQIKVWLDTSNYNIGEFLKKCLLRLFQDFQTSTLKDCNYFDKLGGYSMRFTFEYGFEEEDAASFVLPGMLLTVTFFLGMSLTASVIVSERLEGVWNRSIVAGVSTLEVVVAHFATQCMLVLIQTCEIIIVTFAIYGCDYEGDLYLIFLFILLQGLAGMAVGFLASVVSDNHFTANIICSGLFVPMIILCGITWPLEGQPINLGYISKSLAFTVPIVSLRKVIKKGYGLDELQVWQGLSVNILWILIPLLISIFAMKAKR